MKKLPWGVVFLILCVMAFSMGIVTGFVKAKLNNVKNETPLPEEAVKSVLVEEETLVFATEKETLYYVVVSQGDFIFIREAFSDNSEKVIEMIEINKSVLPEEDIALLEEGMRFETKSEALMMVENFVS